MPALRSYPRPNPDHLNQPCYILTQKKVRAASGVPFTNRRLPSFNILRASSGGIGGSAPVRTFRRPPVLGDFVAQETTNTYIYIYIIYIYTRIEIFYMINTSNSSQGPWLLFCCIRHKFQPYANAQDWLPMICLVRTCLRPKLQMHSGVVCRKNCLL